MKKIVGILLVSAGMSFVATAKDYFAFDKLDKLLPDEKLGELLLLLEATENYDEKLEIGAAFWEEIRMTNVVPVLKVKLDEIISKGGLSPEAVKIQISNFALATGCIRDIVTKVQANPNHQRILFQTNIEDMEEMMNELIKIAKKIIPKNSDQITVNKYSEAFFSFSDLSRKHIIDSLVRGGEGKFKFSPQDKRAMLELANTISQKNKQHMQKFIKERTRDFPAELENQPKKEPTKKPSQLPRATGAMLY